MTDQQTQEATDPSTPASPETSPEQTEHANEGTEMTDQQAQGTTDPSTPASPETPPEQTEHANEGTEMTDQQAQGTTDPSTSASPETPPEQTEQASEASLGQHVADEIKRCLYDLEQPDHTDLQDAIQGLLSHVINGHEIAGKYNLLVFFDDQQGMNRYDTMEIYSSVISFREPEKPTLLVLHSHGGQIEAAYLIGKLCRSHLSGPFVISVPRQAKSAATLLCCAADEIHMGGVSELGPIDPQIGGLPALGLKNSIEHIAELCERYPKSADMFSKYLHLSIRPENLGYYQRIAESAEQYATRLLDEHAFFLDSKNNQQPIFRSETGDIANRLVNGYRDHGFVIDSMEATDLFRYHGTFIKSFPEAPRSVVRVYKPEYYLGNGIHKVMDFVRKRADYLGYDFWFTGSVPRQGERAISRFGFRKRR